MPAVAVAHDDRVAAHVDLAVQVRVHERDVITLEVVVDVGLPVAVEIARELTSEAERLDRERLGFREELAEIGEQVWRAGVEVHEHEVAPTPGAHGEQRERFGVERRIRARGVEVAPR